MRPASGRDDRRDSDVAICCAQTYVAYGSGARRTSGSCVLNALDWKAAIPIAESPAQHIFVWFGAATIAVRLDDRSLDSTKMCVAAGSELKRSVIDRIGRPESPSPLPPAAALLAFLESLQPAQICCVGKPEHPGAGAAFV